MAEKTGTALIVSYTMPTVEGTRVTLPPGTVQNGSASIITTQNQGGSGETEQITITRYPNVFSSPFIRVG